MADLTTGDVRVIVREETQDMREDIGQLKQDVSELKHGVTELGVKFEDFDGKLDAIAELVTTTVETRRDVRSLNERVGRLEQDVAVLKVQS